MSISTNPRESLLFQLKEIDEPDELEVILRQNYQQLQELITGASDNEINFILMSKVSESMDNHMEVTLGLLYGILIESNQSLTYLGYLNAIVRDNFSTLTLHMKRLTSEKYHKMLDPGREQLVWLISELVRQSVPEADALCGFMLRNIIGGNVSPRNIWLAQTMLQLFITNKEWLYSNNSLIPVVLYTYLRIIVDHTKSQFLPLREQEAELCVMLMREKFSDCMIIGRDLIRALQDVAKLPEIEAIWKDLINNPTSLSPHLTSFAQLLRIPTPKTYLQSRVAPEMETHIMFLMREIKMGQQKRYQQWFMLRHLPAPECETLLPDLVRFILGVYHPPNHVICSDIIPRWAVIGWLLKSAKTDYMISQIKLALFYDWLYFDPKVDNIMNIEPGILLLLGSIPKYTDVTAGLLEFLLIVMEVFDPPRKDMLIRGVHNSFRIILDKGVVNNIDPLFSPSYIHPSVLEKAKVLLGPFYKGPSKQKLNQENNPFQPLTQSPPMRSLPSASTPNFSSPRQPQSPNSNSILQPPYKRPQFPDLHFAENPPHKEGESRPWWPTQEVLLAKGAPVVKNEIPEVTNGVKKEHDSLDEDKQIEWDGVEDEPLGIEDEDLKMEDSAFPSFSPSSPPTPPPPSLSTTPASPPPSLSTTSVSLPPSLAPSISSPSSPHTLSFLAPQISFTRENIPSSLPSIITTFEHMKPTPEQRQALSSYLTPLLNSESPETFLSTLFVPSPPSPSLFHILLHSSLRFLPFSLSPLSPTLSLLRALYHACVGFGYRALCFLSAAPRADFPNKEVAGFRFELYTALVCEGGVSREKITGSVLADCKKLSAADSQSFFTLVPYLVREFPYLVGNSDLIYLIVSNLDPAVTYTLSTQLILQEVSFFGNSPSVILEKSLSWESYEQVATWQLLNNELSPLQADLDSFVPNLIHAIDPTSHREAMAGLLQLLRYHAPTRSLVSCVFTFATKGNRKGGKNIGGQDQKERGDEEKRTENEVFAVCVMEGWCVRHCVEVCEWVCEVLVGSGSEVEGMARFLELWKKKASFGRVSGIFHLEHFQKTIAHVLTSLSLSPLFPILLDATSPAHTQAPAQAPAAQAPAQRSKPAASALNPIQIKPKVSSPLPSSPRPSSPLPPTTSPSLSSPSPSLSPPPLPHPPQTPPSPTLDLNAPFSPSSPVPPSASLSLSSPSVSNGSFVEKDIEDEEKVEEGEKKRGRRGRKKKEETPKKEEGEEDGKGKKRSVKRRLSEEIQKGAEMVEEEGEGEEEEEEGEGEEEGEEEVTRPQRGRPKRINGGKKRQVEDGVGEEEGRQTRSKGKQGTRNQPKRTPTKK